MGGISLPRSLSKGFHLPQRSEGDFVFRHFGLHAASRIVGC